MKNKYDISGCCDPRSQYLLIKGEKGFASGVSLVDIISDLVNEPTITTGRRNMGGKITKTDKWLGGSLRDVVILNEVDGKRVYISIPYVRFKYALKTRELLECSIAEIEFGYCNIQKRLKTVDLLTNSTGEVVAEVSTCDYETRTLRPESLCSSDRRSLILVLEKIFKTYHV